MAVLAFVLLFVILGAGSVFVAMNGGPKAARRRVQSRRGGRAALAAFVGSIIVLGVAVPAAVIATVVNRDSIPEHNVAKLTDEEKRGRILFGERCRICHTLAASGASAKVGPNLDAMRPTKGLLLDAIKNGRSRGNGQMAAGLVEGADAEAVADYVAVAVGQPTD